MEGCIFNIQKFSIHDGPGIRSTVFFKGCNLRCKWCANPESQYMLSQLTLDREKCIGCLACVNACAAGARSTANGRLMLDADRCTLCGACISVCPSQAIGREGYRIGVEEALAEVLKDKPFYDHSGGGVTFSGGEVLLQMDFAVEPARAPHQNGVHVAIETAAAVPSARFKAFLKEIDYVFVDLKHYNSARHLEGTGIGNEQVIENIRALVESGLEYCVRIPVIPGYNDAPADALGFAGLLGSLGVRKVQLLPFHQLGERKYSLLDMDYAYAEISQLHSQDLQAYLEILTRQGIDARL